MFSKKQKNDSCNQGLVPVLIFMQSSTRWFIASIRSIFLGSRDPHERRTFCVRHESECRGFSLIELLITSAIITIVTAIVVVKHASFNNAVLLRNQAYEIALAIREAQVYAVSARANEDGSDFRSRYGIFFDTRNAGKNQVIIYIESETTGAASKSYNDNNDPNPDTVLETLVLDSRFEVSDICVKEVTDHCDPNFASISFQRPNFDPIINPSGVLAVNTEEVSIEIAPVNGSSITRTVTVTQTGQVTVN